MITFLPPDCTVPRHHPVVGSGDALRLRTETCVDDGGGAVVDHASAAGATNPIRTARRRCDGIREVLSVQHIRAGRMSPVLSVRARLLVKDVVPAAVIDGA